ncbi:hypothetical protein OIU85_005269 [Salix viminalis]|uniref:Uncharacterized protein n=1 Tax=Salix viminalis TaxID=40686 RepID=A0A9Q0PIW7_SALVM|nr:hypothetical protein OIU85_005269 [Salix viminalis]
MSRITGLYLAKERNHLQRRKAFQSFTETLKRCRDRGVKDDYRSQQRSRSISRSHSPRDGRDYRADHHSLSLVRDPMVLANGCTYAC